MWKCGSMTQAGGPVGTIGSTTRWRALRTKLLAQSTAATSRSQSGARSRINSEAIVEDAWGCRSDRHMTVSSSFMVVSLPHCAAACQRACWAA